MQIWFQNRRQNDRRKSRPLSPQEIAALQYGSMQVLPEYANIGTQPPSSSLPTVHNITSPLLQSSAPESQGASPPSTADSGQHASEVAAIEARDTRRESAASMGLPAGPSSQPLEFTAGPPAPLCRSNSVGYFASRMQASTAFQPVRRSPDSYRYVAPCRTREEPWLTSQRHQFMPAPRPSSAAPGAVLPPPQASKYRLSMSVEGKAELVPQPSPPRLSPAALSENFVPPDRPQLHRSHSAADSITLPPISTFAAPFESPSQSQILLQPQPRLSPRGLYRSRSRDVHAWELACEANSGEHRDELTAYAERESAGSAIAAISLLRTLSSSSHSTPISHTGVLQSNTTTKRTARPSAQQQHSHHHAKKPKLNRAASSIARLQNIFHSTADKPPMKRNDDIADVDDFKTDKASLLMSPGGNDSDKENWSPGKNRILHSSRRTSAGGRRPLPSAPLSKIMPSAAPTPPNSRRRVLQDGGTERFLLGPRASTAPTMSSRRRKAAPPIQIFEDDDGGAEADASDAEDDAAEPTADDEVEKFMRGEGVSPSKKGAASAIAGLLALSQGAWR